MIFRTIAADVRPPAMVRQVPLEAVRLELIISERKDTKSKKRKRDPMTANAAGGDSLPEGWSKVRTFVDAFCSDESEEDQLFDSPTSCDSLEEMLIVPTNAAALSSSSQTSIENPWEDLWCRETFPAETERMQDSATLQQGPDVRGLIDDATMSSLIDGALRLSICNRPSKVAAKMKNNTLQAGLADVAPALWSPQYLSVSKPGAYPVVPMY